MKAGDVVTGADGVRWRVVELPLRLGLDPHHAGRAWEEVDRWNAEQDVKCNAFPESERDLAVKAAVDSTRDRVPRVPPGAFQAVLDRDRNPRDRVRDQLADAGVAVQRQFRSDQERIAELEREREAERTRGIDHAVYEMVCEERDALEARLSRVPALVAAVEHEAYWLAQLATGPWGQGEFTDEPSRLAVQVRHENVAKHARAILAALAEWEKP